MKLNILRKEKRNDWIHVCNNNLSPVNINNIIDTTEGRIEIGTYQHTEEDIQILAKTLCTEVTAINGTMPTLLAMAHVFLNRVKSGIVKSISDACRDLDIIYQLHSYSQLKKGEFSNLEWRLNRSLEVARSVLSGQSLDLTEGCNFFHPVTCRSWRCLYVEPKFKLGRYCFYYLQDYEPREEEITLNSTEESQKPWSFLNEREEDLDDRLSEEKELMTATRERLENEDYIGRRL